MKIRSCPHCNYQYSIIEYVSQILFKFIFSEWNCKNCNNKITFDSKRRVNVALCFGCFYILLFAMIEILKNRIGMTPSLWIAMIILFTIGSILIFTFDTFKKV